MKENWQNCSHCLRPVRANKNNIAPRHGYSVLTGFIGGRNEHYNDWDKKHDSPCPGSGEPCLKEKN